jgi:gamma-D-glutamyl-L-lysine dipeptidyl-peptidase
MYRKKKDCLPRCRPAVIGIILLLAGCSGMDPSPPSEIENPSPPRQIEHVHFTVQLGAFSNVDNAVRLTEALQQTGLNAYHFSDASGYYKVRFGNYSTRELAIEAAESYRARGLIVDYFIVRPSAVHDTVELRKRIVNTAMNFLGASYKWGGESSDEGFDCSGLTMTVYQLNGLDLPRTSRQQWRTGTPVPRNELLRGDLVFFATAGGRRVSHVGIYTGENKFIHAPGKSKRIRLTSLSKSYYRSRFVGARRYL